MPEDISTSFKDDDFEEVKWAAESQGLTVEEFVSHATNRLVKKIKGDARNRVNDPKSIKLLK